MKTKIVLLSTSALLAVGVGIHLSGHCPLHEAAKVVKTQPATISDAGTSLVKDNK